MSRNLVNITASKSPRKKDISSEYQCSLCNKKYKTEGGLLFHKCKNKQRLNSKEELHSRIGFMAYLKFYETLQSAKTRKKAITFEDFAKSSYYNGFIKFGHYVADMKMMEPENYISFLIHNDVPLQKWTDDKVYIYFVAKRLKSEKPDYAIERSLRTMQRWAEENETTWDRYFQEAGQMKIVSNLRTGKISPWIIYNTKSGKQFLASLSDSEVDCVFTIIDPDFWKHEFRKRRTETNAIMSVLKEAGM